MSLINSRVIRIVPITNTFKVFISCEGATSEQLIDIWSISREKFVLGASFRVLQLSCLKILQKKTFKGGLTGIVPYNIRQKGFAGAYGDMYRILSEKFGFSLILNDEKGFGTFNETIGKYQNGLLGKVSVCFSHDPRLPKTGTLISGCPRHFRLCYNICKPSEIPAYVIFPPCL